MKRIEGIENKIEKFQKKQMKALKRDIKKA